MKRMLPVVLAFVLGAMVGAAALFFTQDDQPSAGVALNEASNDSPARDENRDDSGVRTPPHQDEDRSSNKSRPRNDAQPQVEPAPSTSSPSDASAATIESALQDLGRRIAAESPRPEAGAHEILGTVKLETGAPLAGVSIKVTVEPYWDEDKINELDSDDPFARDTYARIRNYHIADWMTFTATTDASGAFHFTGLPSPHRKVEATLEGYHIRLNQKSPEGSQNFIATRMVKVNISIARKGGGEFAPGTTFQLNTRPIVEPNRALSDESITTAAMRSDYHELDQPSTTLYLLPMKIEFTSYSITDESYSTGIEQVEDFSSGEREFNITIELSESIVLRGNVLAPDGFHFRGERIRTSVHLVRIEGGEEVSTDHARFSLQPDRDQDYDYTLNATEPGEYQLQLQAWTEDTVFCRKHITL